MACVCNDNLTKDLTCFNKECEKVWTVPLQFHERVSNCPQHHSSIAMCGGSTPSVCSTCSAEGYYVEREGGGWFPTMTLKKKSV